jgi:hypothetical protein
MKEWSEKSLTKILQEQEEALLDPDIRGSELQLDELLAEEFVEFGSSGVRYDKQSIVGALANAAQNEKLSLTDFNMIAWADGIAAVSYICECHDAKDKLVRRSLRSSLWKEINGKWQIAFHQGTRTGINS